MMHKILMISIAIFLSSSSVLFAQEGDSHSEEAGHEEEETVGGVGAGNAVTAADEHVGLQLSEKAKSAIKLVSVPYSGQIVSASALVYHQDKVSVYRLRGGWYKIISVKILNIENGQASIESNEFKVGDQLVTQGVGHLRVAELDAFSGEVGHSH